MLDLDQTVADPSPAPAPFTPLSDDEINRKLAGAGLPYGLDKTPAAGGASGAPSFQPPPAAPTIPSTGGGGAYPATPKPLAYGAPDLSGGGPANFGASAPAPKPLGPAQPRASRAGPLEGIPGFEHYDAALAERNIDAGLHGEYGQSDAHFARHAEAFGGNFGGLPGYGDPSTAGQRAAQFLTGTATAPSPAIGGVASGGGNTGPGQPDATTQPGQPKLPGAKPYTVGDDGALQLDTTQPTSSLLGAYKDGLIDEGKLRELLPKAQEAETAIAEQKRIAAENPAAWKAFVSGGAKGLGFLAASAPGAAAGAAIGAFGGPLDPITVPAGGIIGGLVTGTLGSLAVDKTMQALGKHSQTIQSFNDASKIHPYADAAGNLVSFAGGIPKAVTGLAGKGVGMLADIAAGSSKLGETGAEVAETINAARAARAAGQPLIDETGQAIKATMRDRATKILADTAEGYSQGTGSLLNTAQNFVRQAQIQAASGASGAEIAKTITGQIAKSAGTMIVVDSAIKTIMHGAGFSDEGQTWGGAAQAGIIGAFLSGHGISFHSYSPDQVADIVVRGRRAEDAGLKVEDVLHSAEADVFRVADSKINSALRETGTAPRVSVEQAIQHGKSRGTAAHFTPEEVSGHAEGRDGSSLTTSPTAPPAPGAPAPAPGASSFPDASARGDGPSRDQTSPPANFGGKPSTPSTNPPPASQAEPVITREGGYSTVEHNGTKITVPTSQEASALEIMRRSSADEPSSAISPRLDPTAPDSPGTHGEPLREPALEADRSRASSDQPPASEPPSVLLARETARTSPEAQTTPPHISGEPDRESSSAEAAGGLEGSSGNDVTPTAPGQERTTTPGLVTEPPPDTRQPVTAAGKEAARTLDRLQAMRDKGVELTGAHRHEQRRAELAHARDLRMRPYSCRRASRRPLRCSRSA